jgi:hypothetical protein
VNQRILVWFNNPSQPVSDQTSISPFDAKAHTKKEFIRKLRQTMTQGIIDNSYIQASFQGGSFQSTFGDPDNNVEWTDGQRLISYRCSDGSIQITVTYVPGTDTVDVTGMNQY